MVPKQELEQANGALQEATILAAAGRRDEGYVLLCEGLGRAREAVVEGEPWAADLEQVWHDALDQFTARYPLAEAEEESTPVGSVNRLES